MSFTTGFAVVPRKMDSGWGVLLTTHSEQLMDADAAQSSMNMLLKSQLSCVLFYSKGLYRHFVEEDGSYISNDS